MVELCCRGIVWDCVVVVSSVWNLSIYLSIYLSSDTLVLIVQASLETGGGRRKGLQIGAKPQWAFERSKVLYSRSILYYTSGMSDAPRRTRGGEVAVSVVYYSIL